MIRRRSIRFGTLAAALLVFSMLSEVIPANAQGTLRRSGVSCRQADRLLVAGKRRAAIRDVKDRLAALQLPSGARRTRRTPLGSKTKLNSPPTWPDTPNLIDRHAWWVVPGQPIEVLEWFQNNPPANSSVGASGSEGTGGGQEEGRGGDAEMIPEIPVSGWEPSATSWFLGFEWPTLEESVDDRAIQITATTRRMGDTALRIDGQAVWISPHSPCERIPEAARVLEAEWYKPGHRRLSATTEDPRFVRKLATLMDRLPVGQPGVYTGVFQSNYPPTVTVRFLSSRGTTLAEGIQTLPHGGGCGCMRLSIRGKQEPSLENTGVVIRRLKALRRNAKPDPPQ
jgi:hypothetical protein